jgi:protoporphyrin/coproporphyrin ferrochelatase
VNTVGVVVMAYGSPADASDISRYYTDIRRGRPPTDEQLADLTRRYDAIGGLSPLLERTEAQRMAVQAALDVLAPGQYCTVLGLKHSDPTIEGAVEQLAGQGVTRVVGVVLAPHYSGASVGQYLSRLEEAAGRYGLGATGLQSWATEPAFVEFLVRDLGQRLATMPAATRVVFTAHSLPARVTESGDPYPSELRATAQAVASELGLVESAQWETAWQSAGRTPEPWLTPDILTVIDRLGTDPDVDGVLVCACGFVSDHLEVLYDLDIEARRRAGAIGLAFDRTRCVNDDPAVMAALAARIVTA